MQGWRKSMEDAHIAQLNVNGRRDQAFFGVFDGHQSDEAARYCRSHMFDALMSVLDSSEDITTAFEKTFKRVDDQICKKYTASGTTANCVLLHEGVIYCANAGDSRAVLYRDGNVIVLSRDHKASDPLEEKRILRSGAKLEKGRINMALAVSRALGDVDFKLNPELPWKEQAVTALPEVESVRGDPQDQFIILACDGVWDVLTNEECCKLVAEQLGSTPDTPSGDISLVCERILDRCLAHSNNVREGTDNMTIIIVQFKPAFFESSK